MNLYRGSFRAAWLLSLTICFVSAVSAQSRVKPADHARNMITPDYMKSGIAFLASDSMKGRMTPGPELDKAAEYIAGQFRQMGLKPLGGSYFHDLNYCLTDLSDQNFISLVDGLQTINFRQGDDFVPDDCTGSRPAEGEVVFAGYGITAPEYGYDDYRDIDVKGKIVVILRQEPGQTDPKRRAFDGESLTAYSWVEEKQKIAQSHGAIALLVIAGPLHYSSMGSRGVTWPSYTGHSADRRPIVYCPAPESKIPVVQVTERIAEALFGSVDSLNRIQERIEKDFRPESFVFPGRSMALNILLVKEPVGGRNVIGVLEGSDPVSGKEALVIGAHYDHVGYRKEPRAGIDNIYNGADDNASGTTGMLAVARAFTTMDVGPGRTVIFMAFAGEERGLLGSATYVREPLWPVEQTVAMINLDMISRNHPDSLQVIGARQYPALARIIRKKNRETRFGLRESKSRYLEGGSDHASFHEKGVPSVFLFTGFHNDYHNVTDEPSRTDPKKAARVAQLAFLAGWTIASEKGYYRKGEEVIRREK